MSTTCTYVTRIHPWTDEEKRLHARWAAHSKDVFVQGFACFISTTVGLAQRMEEARYNWPEFAQFELEQVNLAREDKLDEAVWRWALQWEHLMLAYWPDCAKPAWLAFKEQLAVLRKSLPKSTEADCPELQLQSLCRLVSSAPPP
jgi:hypothetical protein